MTGQFTIILRVRTFDELGDELGDELSDELGDELSDELGDEIGDNKVRIKNAGEKGEMK